MKILNEKRVKQIQGMFDSNIELQNATRRLNELRAGMDKANAEHASALERLQAWHRSQSDNESRATALMEGDTAGSHSTGTALGESEVLARDYMAVVRRAVQMQQAKVDLLRDGIGSQICREIKAEHGKIVADLVAAANALAAANNAEFALRAELDRLGVNSGHLPGMIYPPVGWLDAYPGSPLHSYLIYAGEYLGRDLVSEQTRNAA